MQDTISPHVNVFDYKLRSATYPRVSQFIYMYI
jgi:hypothetical protein